MERVVITLRTGGVILLACSIKESWLQPVNTFLFQGFKFIFGSVWISLVLDVISCLEASFESFKCHNPGK